MGPLGTIQGTLPERWREPEAEWPVHRRRWRPNLGTGQLSR